MDCLQLSAATGWECQPSGLRAIRATSPITLGEDGQHAAFYIASPSETTFFLTDASEAVMHAEHLGIEITKDRLDALNKSCGVLYSQFDAEGSIVATGKIEDLRFALWDAAKLAIALSFKTPGWRPKFDQTRLQDLVIAELAAQIEMKRIIRSARVKGLSGHTLEFPIGVHRLSGEICYIQPIPLNNGTLPWALVWQAHGKFFDIREAVGEKNCVTILENGAPSENFGKAVTFLTHASSVRTLGETKNWDEVLA